MVSIGAESDLVVVGAGVAGWTAARRAQQLGASVVVLEKHTAGPGFGNGRMSGGWFHAAYMNPNRPPAELHAELTRKTQGYARPELVGAWTENVKRALEFLRSEGGVFAPAGEMEAQQNVLQPPKGGVVAVRVWKDRGPDRMLSALWRRFVDADGTFRPGRQAVELVVEGGAVRGVVADTGGNRETYRGRAVLLADGGFQGSPELVAKYITSAYKRLGSSADSGDALLMGLAAGAKTVNMEWFYGHTQFRDALRIDDLGVGPGQLDAAGVVVDGLGRRFTDEGQQDEIMADRIAKSATPGGCWVVFDDEAWETAGRLGAVPPNPNLIENGGTLLSAPTIEALAEAAGLPAATLTATVASVNAHLQRGSALEPPRTGGGRPLVKPPFHAAPLIAGITFAMGGLLVNPKAQVLDSKEKPIAGLYAAGGTMGGLQGGPGFGYAGGWSEAATFGMLAAEDVCASLPPAKKGTQAVGAR